MSIDLRPSGGIGSALGTRYSVVREIARGGMSTVYLANQMPLGRQVALKVLSLPTEHDDLDGLVERFRLEAHALAQLTHPNIVVVHDYGETQDGRFFLAMEHLDGMSLGELFRQGPLTVDRALMLLLQVCSGLRYAHKRGVVHRDLKPSNVMILVDDDGSERVKLVDFGLVKVMESDTSITSPGIILGSPQFMAPEQIRGDDTDLRADIYSFGVMLFRGVTGRYPFSAADTQTILEAHLLRPPPRLCDAAPEIVFPPALETVVARCLAKAPADRFSDMNEVIEGLYPIMGDDPKFARTPLSTSRPTMSRPTMSIPSMSMSRPSMSRPSMSMPTTSMPGVSRPSMAVPEIANRPVRLGAATSKALLGIFGLATAVSVSMAVVAVVSLLFAVWMSNHDLPPVVQTAPGSPSLSAPGTGMASNGPDTVPGSSEPAGVGSDEPLALPAPVPVPVLKVELPKVGPQPVRAKPDPVAPRDPTAAPRDPTHREPGTTAGTPAVRDPAPVPGQNPVPAPIRDPAPVPVPDASPAPVPDGYFGIPEDLRDPPK